MSKVYTLAQVAEHCSPKDCWILLHGKVYDVSKFLEEHPGGDDVILSATGKDATDDFEDVGHSDEAKGMVKDYYIGDIEPSSIPKSTIYKPPKQPMYNPDKSKEFILKILQCFLPLVILGLAFGVRFYYQSSSLS